MRAVVEGLASPLGRVRVVAMTFSVIAGVSCATLIDTQLPAIRFTLAYLAVAMITVNAVVVFARNWVRWWSVLISGPLVALAFSGLKEKPATMALALSLIAGQNLYGTNRMAIVRTAVIATVVPALLVSSTAADGTHPSPLSVAFPIVVIALFSAILRLLYAALHVHQVAARREALLADTSRALLESADLAEAEGIVRSTLVQLADDLGGLDIVVSSAPPTPTPTPTPSAGALTVAFQTTGEVLTVDGPAVAHRETQRFLESLTAQLSLVQANHAAHRELYTMAHHDLMTSLCNRRAFFAALNTGLEGNRAPHTLGVMLIDLDDFKAVNDTHGHAAGDAVLIAVARRMLDSAGQRATLARFGGDEFAVLVHDSGPEDLDALAEQMSRSIRRPIPWGAGTVAVGASVGIASAVAGQSAGDLMRVADLAMYEAKSLGKNQIVRHFSSGTNHDALT